MVDKRTRDLAELLGRRPAELDRELTDESRARLLTFFPVGAPVTFSVKHVSTSGMSRVIAVIGVDPFDGRITNVSGHVARVCGWPFDYGRMGVRVRGCGMDMTEHVLDSLGRALHSDGRALRNGGLV